MESPEPPKPPPKKSKITLAAILGFYEATRASMSPEELAVIDAAIEDTFPEKEPEPEQPK